MTFLNPSLSMKGARGPRQWQNRGLPSRRCGAGLRFLVVRRFEDVRMFGGRRDVRPFSGRSRTCSTRPPHRRIAESGGGPRCRAL